MKISCDWLSDYVDHPLAPRDLAHALTMCGLEVEDEFIHGIATEGIVVGRVLEVSLHPKADHLTLCQVDVGRESPIQIICGAPNVAANQMVAVATIGTTLQLPGKTKPLKIRRSKMRGETSMGMICAEDELGVSEDHSGIMVLTQDAAPGESFLTYLTRVGVAAQDTVLDITITPNRPDATCHMGVARDISALCDLPLRRPELSVPKEGGEAARHIAVTIECPHSCRRYVAMLVRGVTIVDSPLWLQRRLRAIGLRPINNVVDITNFVMHECGQPLHAFDYDEIAGNSIVVRASTAGESITTLDGKKRALPPGTVLICDQQRPVAVGGIMGSENSEVDSKTVNVLIESAYFDPSATRRSARALGLGTDASYRFERGVDSDGQAWAAARAAALIADLAGGAAVEGRVDAHPNPLTMPILALRRARIARILGTEVAAPEVERILSALSFEVSETGPDTWLCRVPPHRPDVSQEVDLIEEVARIHGLDNIPILHGTQLPGSAPHARPEELLRTEVYGLLGGRGYREIYTNSLLPKSEAEQFCDPVLASRGPVVETLNAVSQSMATLRPSLLPGVLRVMQHNQNHGQEVLRFYEFGHVFHRVHEQASFIPGYSEYGALILAISGPLGPAEWGETARVADFFDLKGDVETLLEVLRVPNVTTEPSYESTPLMQYHVTIFSDGTEIGRMGRLEDEVSSARDIKSPVFFSEFNWTRLVLHAKNHVTRRYRPINRYPVVTRDISLTVDRTVPASEMVTTIQVAGQPLLRDATVFDLYADKEVGHAKQSIAFTLRFDAQRTLRDGEVEKAVRAIVQALYVEHGAQLRGPAASHGA